MDKKEHSPRFLKQRKFLMALPLLVLPFILIIFVAFGGGKGSGLRAQGMYGQAGFNMKLPDAHFGKGKDKDKLGLYEDAGKDSARLREEIKNDPYYKSEGHDESEESQHKMGGLENILQHAAAKYNQPALSKLKTSAGGEGTDANEEKVMAKLAILKNELNKKTVSSSTSPGYTIPAVNSSSPDVEKLQGMMKAFTTKNEEDPEMNKLSGMLDKIMLIQHPEKMEDSIKSIAAKNKSKTFPVAGDKEDKTISFINNTDTTGEEIHNSFFGLKDERANEPLRSNTIKAVIEETQTLVSGAVVKLRLLQDIFIHNNQISKDALVYGIASLSNERLKITISSIRMAGNIVPVSLEVYDMDGLEGVYIPGSIDRDVSKQSADQAMSAIGLTSLDPSLGAQAASAGIQAAKTLMSKKIKLIRVSVKAGYQVLLKDTYQK